MNRRSKMSRVLSRHFFREGIHMANKHVKRCLILLIFREMQIRTTVKYYFIPVDWPLLKKKSTNMCWRVCGEKGSLLQCWWECKLVQPLWKTVWRFLKD